LIRIGWAAPTLWVDEVGPRFTRSKEAGRGITINLAAAGLISGEVADQAVQILGVGAEGAGRVWITAGGLAERGEDQFLLGVVEDR